MDINDNNPEFVMAGFGRNPAMSVAAAGAAV